MKNIIKSTLLIWALSTMCLANDLVEEHYNKGLIYYKNSDFEQAANWFNKAAQQGHIEAQYYLGFIYLFHHKDENKKALGYDWIKKAASHGHETSKQLVLKLNQLPQDITQKDKEITERMINEANSGNAQSQFLLAVRYLVGLGELVDEHKAYYWAKKAAEQGHPKAQGMLGTFYDGSVENSAVLTDYKKAHYWYQKSSDQNDPGAQYRLGMMYVEGIHVQRDMKKAKQLIKAAHAGGITEASKAWNNNELWKY